MSTPRRRLEQCLHCGAVVPQLHNQDCPDNPENDAEGVAVPLEPSQPKFKADTLFARYCDGRADKGLIDGKIDWQGWQRVSDYVNQEAAAVSENLQEELAKLEDKLKTRDKCSYIGAMRDCPTHGESPELRRLEKEIAALREKP